MVGMCRRRLTHIQHLSPANQYIGTSNQKVHLLFSKGLDGLWLESAQRVVLGLAMTEFDSVLTDCLDGLACGTTGLDAWHGFLKWLQQQP